MTARTPTQIIGDTVAAFIADKSMSELEHRDYDPGEVRDSACDRMGWASPSAFDQLGRLVLTALRTEVNR